MLRWIAILGTGGLVAYLVHWYATSTGVDDGVVNTVYLAYTRDPVVYVLFAAVWVLAFWALTRIWRGRRNA